MNRNVVIVYFSGTGGTQRIAEGFKRDLLSRDCAVEMFAIDAVLQKSGGACKAALHDSDLVILVFPVHAFDAPDPVYRWIETVDGVNKKTAVISVSGGGEIWPNTGCRNSCCKTLEGKGFEVVYEKMMVMPSNCALPMDDHLVMWLLKVIPEKVAKIVDSIFSGKVRRTGHKMDSLRRKGTQIEKSNANKFVKELKIGEKCNGCGWCSRTCPVGNIVLSENRPEFLDKCVMCFRCVYGCPNRALETNHFMILKEGFDIGAVEKRMKGVALKPMNKATGNSIWLGVKWYLTDRDGF